MDNAMRSLENLMSEALSLANEAGNQKLGRLDDGDLPLKFNSEDSVHTLSVDESVRRSSSEHLLPTHPKAPTNKMNGDDDNVNDGSELPHKSVAPQEQKESVKQKHRRLRPFHFRRKYKPIDNTETQLYAAPDNDAMPISTPDEENDESGAIETSPRKKPNNREVGECMFPHRPIRTRHDSKDSCEIGGPTVDDTDSCLTNRLYGIKSREISICSLDGGTSDDVVDFSTQYGASEEQPQGFTRFRGTSRRDRDDRSTKDSVRSLDKRGTSNKHVHQLRNVSLRNKSHVSIGEGQPFSFTKSARRQPAIARDWSPRRKQFVASVACISTCLIGILVGVYSGLVPSIQYYIADFYHYAILGNVGMYLGLAIPTLFFWPLPLLHGRKPYIVGGLCVAMPLLFPQAVAVSVPRSPNTSVWRVALLLSRSLMGLSLGFASMNFHSILTDLYGASLMSQNPHQEVVDSYDVRRLGGGLGVWLGIWTWCFIGSLSVGFVVGAAVIERLQPSWGLYICIIIVAIVLLLNVVCPEVRRAPWRRSVAELRTGETVSRRLARGEIMMHRVQTGPKWWGQEVYHGIALTLEMLRQPGFTIMAVYSAWIYAQIVLTIVLLGSLSSVSYRLRPAEVGAVVSSVAIGALIAIPFQKANIFSRARNRGPMSNPVTFDKKFTWSSHLVRRAIFTLVLPFAAGIYTVISDGPPIHIVFPSLFAALIGFLSCIAISECTGILMETWDCSDLQPGMTGRSKSSKDSHKRTNYSSFPRVTAGWNFIQGLGFLLAAGATGLGGTVTRRLGQQAATGIVAGILLILTLFLLAALSRFKKVQIIPDCTCSEMDRWNKERRVSLHNWAAATAAAKKQGLKALQEIPEDVGWRPAVLGNPVDRYRRINMLELGSLTRWTEIRKRNKLIDENSHLNRQAVALARDEIQHSARHSMEKILHKISKKSLQSRCSHESSDEEPQGVNKSDISLRTYPAGPSKPPLVAQQESRSVPPQLETFDDSMTGAGRALTERNSPSVHTPSTVKHASELGTETQPAKDRASSAGDDSGSRVSSSRSVHVISKDRHASESSSESQLAEDRASAAGDDAASVISPTRSVHVGSTGRHASELGSEGQAAENQASGAGGDADSEVSPNRRVHVGSTGKHASELGSESQPAEDEASGAHVDTGSGVSPTRSLTSAHPTEVTRGEKSEVFEDVELGEARKKDSSRDE